MAEDHKSSVLRFIQWTGVNDELPERYSFKDSYSDIVTTSLQSDRIERGRVTCTLTVEPCHLNNFGGLHGGFVAAVAERVSIACARTVVSEDRELFLGELGISYLSSATQNAMVTVDGSIIRSGRNVTTVAVDFMLGDTGKLVYTTRATFYTTPMAKL
ncbi:hypothetical protein MLD38_018292 [Melastoma candidum]|uniref:Uncharacterized protein n=1 Tax=Melastoma candidum TaxID=119954 RepID=A0ACB9QSU6_9MYRT|nr:hypothetical protein MLD38_018292 [Melastoma candidum]